MDPDKNEGRGNAEPGKKLRRFDFRRWWRPRWARKALMAAAVAAQAAAALDQLWNSR
ncbi:hypothetical protein GCM10009839_69470 [Catenulispora yoronensis]|uniref:Uncharacterized protein n=1 Tax=Catenulispora yoronensis TaxID=450799 RepID=A0ABN2V6G4_9ACTN